MMTSILDKVKNDLPNNTVKTNQSVVSRADITRSSVSRNQNKGTIQKGSNVVPKKAVPKKKESVFKEILNKLDSVCKDVKPQTKLNKNQTSELHQGLSNIKSKDGKPMFSKQDVQYMSKSFIKQMEDIKKGKK